MEKAFYKMNTSILNDSQYREMINELVETISNLETSDPIHKWQTFILMVKSRSITYSKLKGKIKRNLKNRLRDQICRLEEDVENLEKQHNLNHYEYLKRKLRQMELDEIEGYKKRVRFLAIYEKAEPDIAFCAKIEEKK